MKAVVMNAKSAITVVSGQPVIVGDLIEILFLAIQTSSTHSNFSLFIYISIFASSFFICIFSESLQCKRTIS